MNPSHLCLLLFLCSCVRAPLFAQFGVGESALTTTDDLREWVKPGVRNKSASKGVEVRYEVAPGFDWTMDNDELSGERETVTQLEQFTFKFKIPLVNRTRSKLLFGYEWATEKYYFEQPGSDDGQLTLFQLLDERRLKQNKFTLYSTRAINSRFYVGGNLRLAVNGDYQGLVSLDPNYYNVSGGVGLGKKISDNEEWSLGLSFSYSKLRWIVLPIFVYYKTYNDNFGIELGLPGQAFLRYNPTGNRRSSFLIGPRFYSKWYAINKDAREDFGQLDRFWVRTNAFRFQVHYQYNFAPWLWAYAEGGYHQPWLTRFTPADDVNVDLEADQTGRPYLRVGVFVSPPKSRIR